MIESFKDHRKNIKEELKKTNQKQDQKIRSLEMKIENGCKPSEQDWLEILQNAGREMDLVNKIHRIRGVKPDSLEKEMSELKKIAKYKDAY